MGRNIGRINEAMRRTRVDESHKRRNGVGIRVGVDDRINEKAEGVRVGESGRVEAKLRGHITEFNAISSGCGVLEIALYFFCSLAAAVAARPLAAEEEDLVQSLAI